MQSISKATVYTNIPFYSLLITSHMDTIPGSIGLGANLGKEPFGIFTMSLPGLESEILSRGKNFHAFC